MSLRNGPPSGYACASRNIFGVSTPELLKRLFDISTSYSDRPSLVSRPLHRRRFRSSARMRFAQSAVCLLGFVTASMASVLPRALPTPVSAATARSYLASLRVEAESNSPAYNRDLFNHWITISGQCNTRETVLKRDGTNVVTATNCAATSGNWVSPYDNRATTLASDLDIDHLVPLKEAWVSGARTWTNAQREAFANDLTRPQLIAVTDTLNQSKGDKDPAEWMPPLTSYRCTYARAWVHVKYYWNLSVDSAEKSALTSYLASC